MTSKQLRSQGLSAGAVPKGWQLVRLGDLASLRREKQKPSGNDRHPYLGLENINNWGLINSKRQFQEAISDKTVFHTGDTLYGKLRPNLRKVVRVDFDGICSTDILALFPKPLADGAFLGHILQSDRLYVHAMKGIAGTKMPRTSWDHLRACLRSLQYVKLRLLPEGVIMSHSYSSDISREQFARILPCLESARRRTKPRTVDLYDVFCGVLYLLKSGCQWRMLPADFPDWRTCYKYFRQWSERPDPAKYSILEQVLKKIG